MTRNVNHERRLAHRRTSARMMLDSSTAPEITASALAVLFDGGYVTYDRYADQIVVQLHPGHARRVAVELAEEA